ncbi:DUF3574 domain-containing protein [Streptomyces sp. NPDC054796]
MAFTLQQFTARPRLAALALTVLLVGGGAPAAYAAFQPDEASAARTSAPASATAARGDRHGRPYTETSLLFGTARPDGGPEVTDKEFRAFVDSFVTPRFPDGLTVQDGYGQYRDAHGTIERERSYELVLLYPSSQDEENAPEIEEIRDEYKAKFGQESVARVDDRARVDF